MVLNDSILVRVEIPDPEIDAPDVTPDARWTTEDIYKNVEYLGLVETLAFLEQRGMVAISIVDWQFSVNFGYVYAYLEVK